MSWSLSTRVERRIEEQLDVAVVEPRLAVEADVFVVSCHEEHLVDAVEVDQVAHPAVDTRSS